MADTLFKKVDYTLNNLLSYIEVGDVGLPDLQRPFVWKNSKVRDLFDSMYRGYPVGYLLFWRNELDDSRAIGAEDKSKPPRLLVVDGQQRLTSLYAVLRGIPVVRKDYATERIGIAFNPQLEKFEVADAATRRDRAFIPDISDLWSGESDLYEVTSKYLDNLARWTDLDDDQQREIRRRIQRLHALQSYPFTTLELSSTVDEEQVAEVFVRINSKGEELKQADFILTLMSVFWDEGRRTLEEFCRAARTPAAAGAGPFNEFIEPDPDQLLRVAVAVAFRRARLKYVYSILRGKDLETGQVSTERRVEQFERLKPAQATVLDLGAWHGYFEAIRDAGYLGGKMITSQTNLIYTYALYLLGRTVFHVPERELRRAIARWFFMVQLTGRYTGSSEATLEFDLQRLERVESGEQFVATLDRVCTDTLTKDFWEITLPNDLAKAAYYSPALYAYHAALVLLDARALFSDARVRDLLEPSIHSRGRVAERRHLFPRRYLSQLGISAQRETDQIANYALTEGLWLEDKEAAPPSEYVPELSRSFSAAELREMYEHHALPDGWESMEYEAFLERRRELMAKVVRRAFEALVEPEDRSASLSVSELVQLGEGSEVEFKSTLRQNLHTKERDSRIELAVLKTICGFLNSRGGGRLIIGVSDDGEPVGLAADGFRNEDKMVVHLMNLVRTRFDEKFGIYIHPHFEDLDGERVLVVDCSPARSPAYVSDGKQQRLYVRQGPTTVELPPSQIPDFLRMRFD